jgi:hypothetical protein
MKRAFGHIRSQSLAIATIGGIMRIDRETPPGPTESPTGWKIPNWRGTKTSCSQARRLPTPIVQMTIVAPSSTSFLSTLALILAGRSATVM